VFAVQTTDGPDRGHSFRRPVSLEIRVRSGPCHCGQSDAASIAVTPNSTAPARARVLVIILLPRYLVGGEGLKFVGQVVPASKLGTPSGSRLVQPEYPLILQRAHGRYSLEALV
jgi:hypothetical protein